MFVRVFGVMFSHIFQLSIEFLKRVSSADLLDLGRSRSAFIRVDVAEVLGLCLDLIEQLRYFVVSVKPIANLVAIRISIVYPDNYCNLTYVLAIIAKAIRDGLLEAFEILVEVALFFKNQHFAGCMCVTDEFMALIN